MYIASPLVKTIGDIPTVRIYSFGERLTRFVLSLSIMLGETFYFVWEIQVGSKQYIFLSLDVRVKCLVYIISLIENYWMIAEIPTVAIHHFGDGLTRFILYLSIVLGKMSTLCERYKREQSNDANFLR